MFLKYQFLISHFKILCCVHWYFFFIIKNLSFSYLGFPEAFSMLSTPWLTQVGTHVPVNPPLSDRLPQKIDRLDYLQWFDFFISPEWLFTRGKQRFPKAALWITPAYRKSPQRFVVTSGLLRRGTVRIVILILILDLLLCLRKVSHGINEPSLNQLHRYVTVIQTFFFCCLTIRNRKSNKSFLLPSVMFVAPVTHSKMKH